MRQTWNREKYIDNYENRWIRKKMEHLERAENKKYVSKMKSKDMIELGVST
jgi:hypothetical protein